MGASQSNPFEQAYDQMMEQAIRSSGEDRKKRLKEDHGYLEKLFLEKVWWPAVGNLNFLHPEYEIRDFKDGVRFCDYAYLPPKGSDMILETDGFGPHSMSRWKFGDDLERQNHILLDDWKLLRFSRDFILEKPRQCQQTLLLGLAKWSGMLPKEQVIELNVYERAILHLVMELSGDPTPADTAKKLAIDRKTALSNLRSLADKGLLTPIRSAKGRTMRYVPAASLQPRKRSDGAKIERY
ncbi:TrmB family transcriptional regulator [Cohnella massiliensis]|uniref:TrmB family transcriptional regulator n=1 Tax=Cohnella massiliensis TaxID=1816691 RepID=UPI0011193DEB|nr:TrmB family transcriptional regulator [Cohnella massiliensis]